MVVIIACDFIVMLQVVHKLIDVKVLESDRKILRK